MNQSSSSSSSSSSFIPEYGPHVPEDKDQCLVTTPYGGVGLVIRTTQRRYTDNKSNTTTHSTNQTTKEGTLLQKDEVITMKEIELINWANAGDQSQDDTTTNEHDGMMTKNKDTSSSTSNNGRPIRPTMLYTPIDYPSIVPVVGSDVLCQFGRGRVIEIRRRQRHSDCDSSTDTTSSTINNENNDIIGVVVQLSSWRLANRCKVTCYLQMNTSNSSSNPNSNSSSIRVVRHKKVYEMSIIEKIEYANEIKQLAAIEFTQRHYTKALQYYIRAVDAVKYVQHSTVDLTNLIRADLLLVMITCCNNCATCSIQVQQYDIAIQYAQQALSLIETLEQKKNNSKIYNELVYTLQCYDIQLFGIYKIKSLLIMIRVHVQKDNIDIAIDIIKKARHIIATYITTTTTTESNHKNNNKNHHHSTTKLIQDQQHHEQSVKQLKNNDKEIMKLYTICKERKKVLYQKEKLRAQAMFTTTTITTSNDDNNTSNNKAIQQQIEQSSSSTAATNALKHVLSNIDDDPKSNNNNDKTKLDQYDHQHKKIKSNGNDTHNNNNNNENHTIHTTETKTSTPSNGNNIPWHTDPYFLGGLGVIIGTIGTLLVLSQMIVYPSSKKM